VQHYDALQAYEAAASFQSSPAPKSRCNATRAAGVVCVVVEVSILTGPEEPVQRGNSARCSGGTVSILTGPEEPVQRATITMQTSSVSTGKRVSILTGPEEPVQRSHEPLRLSRTRPGFNPHRPRRAGATHMCRREAATDQLFQSSPAPKSRCNIGRARSSARLVLVFQSSPAPKSRCNEFIVLPVVTNSFGFNPHRPRRAGATSHTRARTGSSNGFNPHRPRRAGATGIRRWGRIVLPVRFQSSPAPKSRCNVCPGRRAVLRVRVSILTGPEEPVQRLHHRVGRCDGRRCFNPHRPRRAGATGIAQRNPSTGS